MEEKLIYQNPIIYKDFSDPDIICVDKDYYMISSSFTFVPGVPVLHSADLIHWEIINYCVKKLPYERYNVPVHGSGTWAPSIRYHQGVFYVFIPMPDEGIFVTKALSPYDEWSPLHCLKRVKGWIDPCPFWDDNGKAYMVFAYAQSRCGIKHRLSICEMDPKAERLISEPITVYDGSVDNPTIEGPKIYKREGLYYIFAPAGGVKNGWQTVLRSRNIYGPYEYRIVLHQGNTEVNGPHQGGWVETPEKENFFIHFQDVGAYGRIVHLQPLHWNQGWPEIGMVPAENKTGEPVLNWAFPKKGWKVCGNVMDGTDEFESDTLSLYWQWMANPNPCWYSLTKHKGYLRMYICENKDRKENILWYAPNLCTQMIPGPAFTVEAMVELYAEKTGDMAGVCILGHHYSYLSVIRSEQGTELQLWNGIVKEIQGEGLAEEQMQIAIPIKMDEDANKLKPIYINISVQLNNSYTWLWSENGIVYNEIPVIEKLDVGTWTGARIGLFAMNKYNKLSSGFGEFDYIRFHILNS